MATNAKSRTRLFPTHVDIPAEARERLVAMLNQHLADTADLRSQAKQAHWNVKGREFYQLHLLFDEVAGELSEFADEIAERATALGGYATGTVRMAAERSEIPEYPTDAVDSMEHVAALVERMGLYANRIRHAIDESNELGDPSTADLYTQISREVDKRLWFLQAHLQGRGSEGR